MRTFKGYTPKEKREEIISMYLSGANSYEELGDVMNLSTCPVKQLTTLSGKKQKTVNQNQ